QGFVLCETEAQHLLVVDICESIRVYKPNITLLSREDGDRIVLECQLNDYFPDNLSVQWLDGEKSVGGQIAKKFQNADKGETNGDQEAFREISADSQCCAGVCCKWSPIW
uniref:Ig-like domain-containing protein n=1 Tax=Cyprinus carpio TaxID=7962 RepID=A0A8C2DIA5_CYPCA